MLANRNTLNVFALDSKVSFNGSGPLIDINLILELQLVGEDPRDFLALFRKQKASNF